MNPDAWVTLARLGRPRGRKGELTAVSLSSHPQRLREVKNVYLFASNATTNEGTPFLVEDAWPHRGGWVLKFRGIDSIPEAEAWRGAEMRIPLAERRTPGPGEYYLADLVGCRVWEHGASAPLGEVVGWEENAGQVLLVVAQGSAEVLVPFAAPICVRIDPAARRIEVALPEGLRELNRG